MYGEMENRTNSVRKKFRINSNQERYIPRRQFVTAALHFVYDSTDNDLEKG